MLRQQRAWLFAHDDHPLSAPQVRQLEAMVERRRQGEPIAYILGRRGFWSLDLEVTPATLIPRPETELLVEWALTKLPFEAASRVADLGTGSGAIALALASERPSAQIVATDVSDAALRVARHNARRLGLANVRFAEGSWCTALQPPAFDLIVSNPPYIESGDAHLEQGDLRFEPASALASGQDGLDDIRAILADAPSHLKADGWLAFEHGWNQGAAVRQLLVDAGYREVFTAQDLESRDRISGGRCPSA